MIRFNWRPIRYILSSFMMIVWLLSCTHTASFSTEKPAVQVPLTTDVTKTEKTSVSSSTVPTELARFSVCQESGEIERFSLSSKLMNGGLAFSVYFPPCYDENAQETYPVVYLLHGQKQDDTLWEQLGLRQTADALIQSGAVKPFLLVMPYEKYYWRSPDNTNFPQALLKELIPWIEANLPACNQRECRAIGGISRGASWAMRLALTEWQYFSAVGAHSLPPFYGDLRRLPKWLKGIPHDKLPRIYIDIGAKDPSVKDAYLFEQILNENGILHEWHLNEGQHNEAYWRTWMADYLSWYTLPWRLEESMDDELAK